jgi:hypothetical protein
MSLGVLLVPLGVPRLDLVEECGLRRDPAPQTLTTQMAEFDLRPVEPTAVFGGIMKFSFIRDSFRLTGIQCFIQRGFRVGMQIVHPQTNLLHVRRMLINQCLHKVRPITLCPLLSDCGIPLTSSWFTSHKHVRRPIALILGVISQRLPRRSRERSAHCAHQLGRYFIYAHWGTLRIIRLFIDISDFFPMTDEGRLWLWWDTPFFLVPGFTCIVFQVRRIVSCDTASTISNSTILSARMRKVHRSWPSGA